MLPQRKELRTSVYRKPTSTFKIIDAQSAHSLCNKIGTLNCLINRAFRLCDPEFIDEELKTLFDIFTANGYSASTINKAVEKVKSTMQRQDSPQDTGPEQVKPHLLILPFDENLYESMRPLRRRHNLKIITKPTNKLRKHLVHPKDKTAPMEKCNIVYSVPFSDGNMYIGETSRPLETRIKEHKEAVRRLDTQKSAIAQHVAQTLTPPLWNEVKILTQEDNWYRRRIKEALWIDRKGKINRSHGLETISNYWVSSNNK